MAKSKPAKDAGGESPDRYQLGLEKRAQLFGPSSAPGGGGTQKLAPYYSRWILENVFGDLWSRPALGDKTRVLITMVSLVMSHSFPQLKGYLAVALRVGWTKEEVVEILVQMAPYAGVPTVHNALDVFQQVLAEAEAAGTSE